MSPSLPSYLKLHAADHDTQVAVLNNASIEQQIEHMELAAGAAVILHESVGKRSNEDLQQILADATLATGSAAAIIYLLDDATELLTTRFVFGISSAPRLGSSRPLRGARGDLEAMVQGIFTTDGLYASGLEQTATPERFSSAICVCLGRTDLPIGTVWFFRNDTQISSDQAQAAARLAAANICHTLASLSNTETPVHDSRRDDGIASHFDAEQFVEAMDPLPSRELSKHADSSHATEGWANQIADWQCDTLPLGSRLAPGWSVDGMVESPLSVGQSWHHWDVLPDGILTLAMCQFGHAWNPAGNLIDTLDGTVARAALQAHVGYRHTPQDAMTRIMHTLLQVRDGAIDDSGCPNLSLLYAHVDPQTGHAVISSIGDWSSLIVSKNGYRPLSLGRTTGSATGGFPRELPIRNHETTLLAGEVLLVTGANWMGMGDAINTQPSTRDTLSRDCVPNDRESMQHQIGAALKRALMEGERSPLSALRRYTASRPLSQERTAITLMHELNG